jgi:assimilatory nitrate reductase electron transfer subunit
MSTLTTSDRAPALVSAEQVSSGAGVAEAVVVVGAGMVGHRFVEEVVRRDPEERLALHLVGEEDSEPYNRILLTEVLAGRASLRSLTLPRLPERVSVHRGTPATAVDRDRREVLLADGRTLRYDRLVLATGARPFVPPIAGLEQRPQHVHVVRDLGDTRAVVARAMNAHHAVVLGGGVLGLEAACALAGRGVAVTVVQNEPQLMAGQLDEAPAAVLREALVRLRVHVRVGCSVAEAVSAYGELVAVRLTDDTVLSTDLLLVSCGVRAETRLARDAGLSVDRGVLVGEDLASPDDDRVHALGDCAQPPEGMTGLLAPGWTQAARLARRLTAVAPARSTPYEPARPAGHAGADVRLKAVGIDLCVLGTRPSRAAAEDRVISVDDPRGGRHVGLVVRGERLVGATCLGAPALAAELSVLLERGTPVPEDPLALVAPERGPAAPPASPTAMPGATTVCRCNGVTKHDVVTAWEAGATTVDAVAGATRATTGCGGCTEVVCGLVSWLEETAGAEEAAEHTVEHQFARP